MIKITGNYIGSTVYVNGNFIGSSDVHAIDSQYSNSIYEVLRIISGIPLFIEDHFGRFENSLEKLGIKHYPSLEEIKQAISGLCRKNKFVTGNIRFELAFNKCEKVFILYQVPHHYPNNYQYENGVKLLSYPIDRPDPNIKQSEVGNTVKAAVNHLITKDSAYEVLLVNSLGEITEGSRSNIFFVDGSDVFTPPLSVVLEGITRRQIIKIMAGAGIQYHEVAISREQLPHYKGCFLSGTSPKVLPVASIDNIAFNPGNTVIRTIMGLYNHHIEEYCRNY